MISPLGPVLANIIMTELESTIAKELVNKSLVKLYMRYVDNTLLLVKDKDIYYMHKRLNSFDKNIKFTVETSCSSKQAFQQQINHIKTLMSWNAYPNYVRNFIFNRLKSKS